MEETKNKNYEFNSFIGRFVSCVDGSNIETGIILYIGLQHNSYVFKYFSIEQNRVILESTSYLELLNFTLAGNLTISDNCGYCVYRLL